MKLQAVHSVCSNTVTGNGLSSLQIIYAHLPICATCKIHMSYLIANSQTLETMTFHMTIHCNKLSFLTHDLLQDAYSSKAL